MNFFSSFLQYKKIMLIAIVMLAPISAYADDDHANSAQTLGWVSIGAGVVANVLFAVFNAVRKLPLVKIGIGGEMSKMGASSYKPMLNFHIMLNSVGFFAGMSHGLMLLRGLDFVSLSLAIIMTVSMISGIILKFASDRNLKFFGRLVHGQIILSILLVSLVTLHVVSMGGD